ncbi:MAG: HTH domain-containing protein, partial [Pseudomonadota bacterium]
MQRSVRFFEIIQFLRQSDEPVTARELADRLEVNIRTIYRDMASLQASNIPIAGEAGIGYIMRTGFDLPPLMFTQDEIEAVIVG